MSSKPSAKRKRSVYIPEPFLQEMQNEANRQEQSLSWVIQQAWKIARLDIMSLPSVLDFTKQRTKIQQSDP